jgi:hypothetical protein
VQPRVNRWLAGALLLLVLLLQVNGAESSKRVRLRNGVIETPPAATRSAAPAATAGSVVSGLFLIQFEGRYESAWRAELEAAGVELLHFVPDDAFVARLNNASLAGIRAMDPVRWVGPLEPKYKVDGRVIAALRQNPREGVAVKVLLRPDPTGVGEALVRTRMQGVSVNQSTSLGPVATGRIGGRDLVDLARSGEVIWIEAAPRMKLMDEVSTKIVAGETFEAGGLAWVHELGFDGTGVSVAVADSGLDLGFADLMHPDLAGRVDAFFAYDGLEDASDEHSHGTHCAGIVAGNGALGFTDEDGALYGLGVAPGAHIVAQRMFDGQGNYRPPPSFEALTRDAVRAGAAVGSNSWGDSTQGRYDLSAAEFDALVRDADALTPGDQQYILEFSAGNSGPGGQTIGSPAVAKNVIATGACQNNRFTFGIYAEGQEVMADFSSRGPCEDGRIKPDVVAPGTWIASLKSQASGDENAWSPIDNNYLYQGGTSQAGPHVSGACAIFVQWYRETRGGATPSPALVKAALINSADDMGTALVPTDPDDPEDPGEVVGDTEPVPNNDEGWGRINLETLIDSERTFELFDQGVELATGQVWERRVVVSDGEPLKVTLVYTDVPGLPAAIPALVNDLDLEVISPAGLLYRGNAFAEGESTPETPLGDRINNVEGVHLASPPSGEWIVRVRAVNVVQDIRRRAGTVAQDFAVVVSGQLPEPGEGVLSWDRGAFQVPSTATVRLLDDGLRGQSTATVRLLAGNSTNSLTLTLRATAAPNQFTGSVMLVSGPAGAGQLQVVDGDVLRAVYTDAQPAGLREAQATIDNAPPGISDVVTLAQFGRVNIRWLASEPSASRVYYGTTNAVTNVVEDLAYRTTARLELPPLEPGNTYFLRVVATDRAGNSATNDNGGFFHRVVAPRPATALLVYTPEAIFTELLAETPYPGIETWTSTLDALGIEYEIWDTTERGIAPTAEQLKLYRLVLWRPEELQGPPPGILAAMSGYVASGGSLFVASFDLLTRLKELNQSAFGLQTLKVASFQEDFGAVQVTSVPGDPVGSGAQVDLDYSEFPSGFLIDILGIVWETGPDSLQLSTNAAPVFVQEDGRIVGLRYPRTGQDGVGRLVYLSFALESLPAGAPAPNNRATVLGNALEFLVPGLQGLSTVALSSDAFTVPGSGTIEVSDFQRSPEIFVEVTMTTTTSPTPSVVECYWTPVRGVFRGRFVLQPPVTAGPAGDPPSVPGAPTRLAARHGDTVEVRYAGSAGRAIVTTARVDTVAPKLTGLVVQPAYNEAILLWETDKSTDALVRFGEAGGDETFLTRTAYSAEIGGSHEVLIKGLVPDRLYYFVISSRDSAGNVGTDNNGGKLYTFRTLKPVTPPWLDDLENGYEGWAVYDDDSVLGGGGDDEGGGGFALSGWAYGTPQNRYGVEAHSGDHCWGTNLGGADVDFAITDLISPAVSLVGGNRARLTFWHQFDFATPEDGFDDEFGDLTIEVAQVAVSTDDGATWRAVYANQEEATDGWVQESLDLTPFLGQVVRFRFNYQMFAFTSRDRLGWLIDDVGVEMTTVGETGLVVSNNLAQARFVVTRTTNSWVGEGTAWRTNLPSGEYTISWAPVRFYQAPAPQSFQVGGGTNLTVVRGTFSFADVNANGISDPWETRYFGGLLTTPATGDRDGDGASERMEFQSGTDPTDRASALSLMTPRELPNRTVEIEWTTTTGREYVLEVSTDLETWQAFSQPARGDGENMVVTLPALDPRLTYLFRVRVTP